MLPNDDISSLLAGLFDKSADVEACALVSEDGQILASSLPAELEESRIAATSSVIVSMASRTVEDFKRGDMEHVIVKGQGGYVILLNAGPQCVLLTLLKREAKLGLLFFYLAQVSEKIKRILS
jgi:predicted regulator of Ras-like GTPase activity (Roadblock/LC7/MglB family)